QTSLNTTERETGSSRGGVLKGQPLRSKRLVQRILSQGSVRHSEVIPPSYYCEWGHEDKSAIHLTRKFVMTKRFIAAAAIVFSLSSCSSTVNAEAPEDVVEVTGEESRERTTRAGDDEFIQELLEKHPDLKYSS